MRNKGKNFLILTLLALMLSACVGPPADDKCIPSDGSKSATPTSSPGSSSSAAEKIDKFIKDGKIITTIVTQIKDRVIGPGGWGASAGIFNGFINNVNYQMAVAGSFTLFMLFYGVGIVTGMVQASLSDAVIRMAKLGFISMIAISWDNFYGLIGTFFIDGTDELIAYFVNNFKGLYNPGGGGGGAGAASSLFGAAPSDITSQIFSTFDDFIARVFSFQTFAFVSAMFNIKSAGPYAPVYAIFLVLSLMWVLQSIIKVVSVYVFSLFGKALLFAIAPIFLLFMLFNYTKPMFDAWLKQLVNLSLQPILITAYIGLFARLLDPFFNEFAQYKLCWNKLDNTTSKYGWTFVNPDSSSNDPVDFGASSTPPISLQAVLLFTFFSWLFFSAMKMTEAMCHSISQSIGTNIGNLASFQNFKNVSSKGLPSKPAKAAGDTVTDML